jgi:hypothetical protein
MEILLDFQGRTVMKMIASSTVQILKKNRRLNND